jgi:hypothetical protein
MKAPKKLQLFLTIVFVFSVLFSNCENIDEDSTITIMDQDEQDNRVISDDSSNNPSTDLPDLSDTDSESLEENSQQDDTNIQVEKTIVIEQLPEAKVILPIRRKDTSHTSLNISPCGGIEKRKADTLTNKGSIFNVIWETISPVPSAHCTVKLSPGLELESNFTVLYPLDIQTDSNGSFPCGRVKGFESQQFKLPDDYECDQCTVQWAWHTEKGVLYSCSDVIINGNKIQECLARCQNGGACFNGKCLCKEGTHGDFCEYSCN